MIKIITGYSGPGGSTIALRNLCKEFNKRDIECEMYGNHPWFLDGTKFTKGHSELVIDKSDKLIAHSVGLAPELKDQTKYFCHEMWWFDFNKIEGCYDRVVFLNERQKNYHQSKSKIPNTTIIPNVKETIFCVKSKNIENVAGIIGAIEPRKNTKESIQRALEHGCEKVLMFGAIQDQGYYKTEIEPLLVTGKVEYLGFCDKPKMYSMIGKVFHSSKGEVASLVKDECYTTGTEFFGNEETENEVSTLTNDEVIELWVKEFQ